MCSWFTNSSNRGTKNTSVAITGISLFGTAQDLMIIATIKCQRIRETWEYRKNALLWNTHKTKEDSFSMEIPQSQSLIYLTAMVLCFCVRNSIVREIQSPHLPYMYVNMPVDNISNIQL